MKKEGWDEWMERHRDEFDDRQASNEVWERITAQMDSQDEDRQGLFPLWSKVLLIAASLALLITLVWTSTAAPDSPTTAVAELEEPRPSALSDLSPDLAEVDRYYGSQIAYRTQRIAQLEVDDDLLEELDFLRQEFEQLQDEMGQSASPELVIEAMIENYRLRLDLLKELQEAFEYEQQDDDHVQDI